MFNEGFCLALAGQMKLTVASAVIHRVADRVYLLVDRYDRVRQPEGALQRLHQEDFSLIYTGRGTVLAPLYDALSTAADCKEMTRCRPIDCQLSRRLRLRKKFSCGPTISSELAPE